MINGSIHLGTYAGIPLRLHWTFSFIIFVVVFAGLKDNREYSEIGVAFLLVLIMFLCVVFHEYGHALMAKRLNVKTVDIILSPIGGLARLEKLPKNPMHEFYIAIAGPLVNCFICLIIGSILFAFSKPIMPDLNMNLDKVNNWATYLSLVFAINLVLFLFNLVPAFPMDGGRILRSLLSVRFGKKKSTDIAAFIGFGIALMFIIWGILNSYYTLIIIGVFVMLMARGERKSAKQEDFLLRNYANDMDEVKVGKVYNDAALMKDVIEGYRDKEGRNFLVMDENTKIIKGVVTEESIRKAINEAAEEYAVNDFVTAEYYTAENNTLQGILNEMKTQNAAYLVITDEDNEQYIVERGKIFDILDKL